MQPSETFVTGTLFPYFLLSVQPLVAFCNAMLQCEKSDIKAEIGNPRNEYGNPRLSAGCRAVANSV